MRVGKREKRQARKRRIRAKIRGTSQRPRLTVYRSLRALRVQVIDDTSGKVLATASSGEAKVKHTVEGAKAVGLLLAEKVRSAGVSSVVFDRNAYTYHGRVRALAEGVREGGLTL